MSKGLMTPEKWYARLLAGEIKSSSSIGKSIGRLGWNEEQKSKARSLGKRYFDKGKDGMPATFYPGGVAVVATGKKGPKKKKSKALTERPAELVDRLPMPEAHMPFVAQDDPHFHGLADELYGPDARATISYLQGVVTLHKDVIESFGRAKEACEAVDTSEVQGAVNSLGRIAELVAQETSRGIGVLVNHLPLMRTPSNKGKIVSAPALPSPPPAEEPPPVDTYVEPSEHPPATNIPRAFQGFNPVVTDNERKAFQRTRPPFIKPPT